MTVSRQSLYKTIYEDVVDKILSGKFESGQKLPSESELEELYDASRTPVRQALTQLESDGFIFRLQGRGSFVANRRPGEIWTRMTGFVSHYKDKWEKISSRTIEISTIRDSNYGSMLHLNPDKEITFLRRIRYFSETPILYLEHFISSEIPIDIFESDSTFLSLNEILFNKFDIKITEADEEIEAVSAPENVAKFLHIPVHSPVLKVTRVSVDNQNKPVDVNVYYVSTDKWKYRVKYSDSE